MNKKVLGLIPLLFLLVSVQAIVIVQGAKDWKYSVPYTGVNVDYANAYDCGVIDIDDETEGSQQYDNWVMQVTNYLTYNETTNGFAIVLLRVDTDHELSINMKADETFLFYIKFGADTTEIGNGTWTSGKPIVVTLYDGYLNVGTKSDRDHWINDYVIGPYKMNQSLTYGNPNGTNYIATSGYVSLEYEKSTGFAVGDITDMILEWIPIIVTIACIGILLGGIKKFGKI